MYCIDYQTEVKCYNTMKNKNIKGNKNKLKSLKAKVINRFPQALKNLLCSSRH